MNKKQLITIVVFITILLVGILAYFTKINNHNQNIGVSGVAPIVIYKTKYDYFNLVPVGMSSDKKTIISHPDIRDIYYNGKLAYPTKLDNEYLLDNRGVGQNSAFLKISYDDFSKLPETPFPAELTKDVLDTDPFTEMYDCKNILNWDRSIITINLLIDSEQLSKCIKII